LRFPLAGVEHDNHFLGGVEGGGCPQRGRCGLTIMCWWGHEERERALSHQALRMLPADHLDRVERTVIGA
jgi:hypothetical protein